MTAGLRGGRTYDDLRGGVLAEATSGSDGAVPAALELEDDGGALSRVDGGASKWEDAQ